MFHLFLFLSMFTAKQIHCMFHLFLFLSMFTAKQIYCMIYLFLFHIRVDRQTDSLYVFICFPVFLKFISLDSPFSYSFLACNWLDHFVLKI